MKKSYFGRMLTILILGLFVSCYSTALAANPILPFDEYFADPEPYVFDGRVYIYGSHDILDLYAGGCAGDYVAWSAPVDDLTDWKYHGILYEKSEDPDYEPGGNILAGDCVEKDGVYYLFYSNQVAKSNSPAGPFKYYGQIHYQDGTPYEISMDPAILVDDDGKNYLYSGGKSSVVELDDDMLSIINGPIRMIPRADEDPATTGCVTNYEDLKGHAFYEGSSIRKINGLYYLLWPDEKIYEYAYATSESPIGPWQFRGVILSNNGQMSDDDIETYPDGNIHGGILDLNGEYYIFYHRQTNGVQSRWWSARQACAEKITIQEDGTINRVEMTSQGLNGKPLNAIGEHSTFSACYLRPEGSAQTSNNAYGPYVKQFAQNLHGISNITNNSVAGFKYFDFGAEASKFNLTLGVRYGLHNGIISIYLDAPNDDNGTKIGEIPVTAKPANPAELYDNYSFYDPYEFHKLSTTTEEISGVHALYFVFKITDEDVRSTDTLCETSGFSLAVAE